MEGGRNKLCFWYPKNACQAGKHPPCDPLKGECMTDDDLSKARGGRPKKAPEEQRSERLSGIRVTGAERAFLEAQAEAAGLPVAEYCRRAILGHRIDPRRTAIEDKALYELNRAGVNLHQISRALNFGQSLPPDFAEVLDDLKAAIATLAGGRS